jgi:DNA-binding SARP family transcriptional activator/WD40 repeat protein
VRIAVLGPLEVDEGRTLLAPRDQVVLEALATRPGETVRAESLAEALWGEHLPPSWPKVVQGCVSRLRKALGSPAIATSGAGYRLVLHRDDFDHLCFEDLLRRAGELLATGEPERARYASGQALGLWRGDPLERLTEWESGRIESERLGERRRDAEDLYAESTIRSGRHGDVMGELHRMVAQQPTRERRWGLLALAQYQAGRQAEALGTLQRARATLVTEYGLDPGPHLAELEEAILRQDPALVAQGAAPVEDAVCPYLGLVAYDVGDAPAYFGREADVVACLQRLDDAGILAVVGPSGCGKSSLIRAGVAAALVRDGHALTIVTPGAHPEEVLAQAPSGAGAVFVVDQCEEALALDETSAEREAFFAGLVDFAARGRLVISLRADRLGELAAHPDFAHLVEKGLYLLGGMGQTELRSAIEGPAAQAGLRLEPGLVDLLVREAEGSPGALPLLSHVLRQTWRRREGDTLTVEGYAATGGVREAVAQSAERLYRDLTPTQQGMLRDLMVRLVSSDDAGEPVRTRVSRRIAASDEEHTVVVEALVGARLLSSDGDTVEIAHESLAVAWPRLRSWLDDDVDGLRIMRHLTVAAESWDELARPDSELYRGVRQARAAEWRRGHDPQLTPPERAFLDASAELAETEERATEEQVRRERRSNQRLRAGLAGVAALLAVAIVAGALAKTAADRADQESVRAEQQSRVADARRLGAEALRSAAPDLALLLAVAGARLDDSPDTRSNLAAVLERAPELIGVSKVLHPIALTVRPDGRAVAVTGWDIGVTIVSTETRKEVARNHDIPLMGVRFNPNGTQLAAAVNVFMASGERRVDPLPLRMFDPQTAALAPTQLGGMPKGRVVQTGLAFSNNGRWLAAVFELPSQLDDDRFFRVWDTGNLARPAAAFTLKFGVGSLAVSDDGTRVYASGDEVHTLDVTAGREIRSAPGGGDAALSPDGSTLAVVRGSQIALLDPERLTVKSVIEEEAGIGELMFSPTGEKLGYEAGDDTLVVRSLADPDASGVRLSPKRGPGGIGFSPDGRTLYSRGDDRLLMWDLVGDRRFVRSLRVEPQRDSDRVGTMVSPDGRTVANLIGGDPESFAVQFLDVKSGTRTPISAFRESNTYIADLSWRPDSRVFASVQNDQWVDLWDAVTGRAAGQHRVPDRYGVVESVKFSGDGARLVVGTHQGWVYTVDASTLKILGKPVEVKASVPVRGLAANHDGARALVWIDRTLRLLDLMQGRVLKTADPGLDVEGWAWMPDGKTVVVVGSDPSQEGHGTVAFLDPTSLSTRSTTSGPHIAGGYAIQFSPDGGQFTTSGAGRVGLWDVRTRGYLGFVPAEGESHAGFAQGTSEILIASVDGEVSVWDPRPETAVTTACRIAGRDLTEQERHSYLPGRERVKVC